MTEYDWQRIRTNAIRKLGDTPGNKLEQDLIDAFQTNPRHIVQIIDAVIAERDAGATFVSAWAIIRHRAQQHPEPITATDQTERDNHIRLAETWIRTAGLYLNDENELLHELFGEQATTPDLATLHQIEQTTRRNPGRPMYEPLLQAAITKTELEGPQPLPDSDPGRLHPYDTPQLRERMLNLYREHRPRGQAAEQDHEHRAHERARLRQALKEAQCHPNAVTPSPKPSSSSTANSAPATDTTSTSSSPAPANQTDSSATAAASAGSSSLASQPTRQPTRATEADDGIPF